MMIHSDIITSSQQKDASVTVRDNEAVYNIFVVVSNTVEPHLFQHGTLGHVWPANSGPSTFSVHVMP
jgi:hypothetical protein